MSIDNYEDPNEEDFESEDEENEEEQEPSVIDLPPGMGGIFQQPFIIFDNDFMLRKDFVVGVKKINNFEAQVFSIMIYYESIEGEADPSVPEYLSMQYGGQISRYQCFNCPLPEERDDRFEEIKLQLNVI